MKRDLHKTASCNDDTNKQTKNKQTSKQANHILSNASHHFIGLLCVVFVLAQMKQSQWHRQSKIWQLR